MTGRKKYTFVTYRVHEIHHEVVADSLANARADFADGQFTKTSGHGVEEVLHSVKNSDDDTVWVAEDFVEE